MAIVDLSHPITDGLVTYPGLPGPTISDHLSREASRARYAPGYEFQIGRIEMVSNTGTYLDTPFHRFADGHDLAGLDLARVVDVPGVLVDATGGQEARRCPPMSTSPGGRCCSTPAGTATGTPTRYGDPAHPFVGMAAVERARRRRRRGRRHRLGEHRRHPHRRAAGAHRAARRRHPDRRAPARPRTRCAATTFTFTAVPPAVVGMGTFPVRALARIVGG